MSERIEKHPELGFAGNAFWVAVLTDFDLRTDERHLLYRMCKLLDHLDALDEELKEQPYLVEGSMGQLRTNPILAEVTSLTRAFASLHRQFGFDAADDDERNEGIAKSNAGRKLALVRHHGGR